MDFETLKPLFLVLFGIIFSSFEPVWKLLQFFEFSMQFLAIFNPFIEVRAANTVHHVLYTYEWLHDTLHIFSDFF